MQCKITDLYRIEPGDLMDLQENLKVENSLRTLKNIQMEGHASKQGEAGVFCELLIRGRGVAENEGWHLLYLKPQISLSLHCA